ncbi:MAG: MEDS domain-containing protein [Desulfobacterales bacterium]|nr:MEDS domain-containing protein [Desulfobacterales bacterium]
MKPNPPTISLGFAAERFPAGVHICQIFKDDDERQDSLLRFLLSGLQAGERTSCFSDKVTESIVTDFLGRHGISCAQVQASGAFTMATTRGIYFQDDRFDPERMLSLLTKYHEDSVQQGYPAARVIGEMIPAVQAAPGGSRLLEYEAKVSLLLREHPVTAVCQYDARSFDGATIMDILKVHPLMVVRGSVVHNPFYIPPEEFLAL